MILKNRFITKLMTTITVLALFAAASADPGDNQDVSPMGSFYTQRPQAVKEKIDEIFNKLAEKAKSGWFVNGTDKYYLCHVDDEKLILDIIKESPEQKEFYLVDVGAGMYQWVDNVYTLLQNNPNIPKDKHYHIIGLNGEGKDKIEYRGNITVYKLGGFKIENIIEAFEARGMHLNGKIDLMVSQYTLKHLVDPLGTFLQMLELTKTNGYLLLEGIPFLRVDSKGNYIYGKNTYEAFGLVKYINEMNLNAEHLLRDLKQTYLMGPTNPCGGYSLRDIIIHKSEVDPNLRITLSYYDISDDRPSDEWSKYMTRLQTEDLTKLQTKISDTDCRYRYFNGSQELYDMLKRKGLIVTERIPLVIDVPEGFVSDFIQPA